MRVANILVNRSEHHSVPLLVGAWEILVLQYEYGPEKVEINGFKKLAGRAYPDAQYEFERLSQKYGIDTDSGATKASLTYGQGAMGANTIRNMIEQEKAFEALEGDSLEIANLELNVIPNPVVAAPAPTEVIPPTQTLSLPKTKAVAA